MAERIPRTIKTAWTELGRWHKDPGAPNGSTPGGAPQRYNRTVEVYEADYYGKGPKLYMDSRTVFQSEYGVLTLPNSLSSDGHLERIAKRLAEVGASV